MTEKDWWEIVYVFRPLQPLFCYNILNIDDEYIDLQSKAYLNSFQLGMK